jgi:Calx-beta domain/FG-GAP-like repeat
MSSPSWLRSLLSALAPRPGQRQHRRRGSLRPATHWPNLEVLEDRLTPSLNWVGYLPPGGYGAVAAAPPPLTADVTGDGIDDLIDVWDGGVSVRPGRGDGTFANPIYTNTPTGPSLALDDFNGDGRLDIFSVMGAGAASDFGPSGILLLGRGNGTFRSVGTYPLGLATAQWYGTGDVDGDGRADVAVLGYDWDDTAASVLLLNDGNWGPYLSVSDATVKEGNMGTAVATFTVGLSDASTQPVTVAFATGDGSAIAGSDYQAAGGTLTFAPGETSKTITVLVNGDRLPEPNETFFVNLSSPTNATITVSSGTGRILDDEPRISISDVSKYEGKKNQTTLFTFTVTLSAAYDQPVTMSYRSVDGTGKTSDADYMAKTGTLTFNPGETTKTITIVVNGDSKKEADETFYLDLFGLCSNGLFTKNRGTGTILNDD